MNLRAGNADGGQLFAIFTIRSNAEAVARACLEGKRRSHDRRRTPPPPWPHEPEGIVGWLKGTTPRGGTQFLILQQRHQEVCELLRSKRLRQLGNNA
jgi:hypothetical protein